MYQVAYVLMSKMFEEFQFSICPLWQDWCRKWFHNLFDRHSLTSELISGRTDHISPWNHTFNTFTHHTRPKAPIPTGCKSVYLNCVSSSPAQFSSTYLEVISKVVPKIWALTNSAILMIDLDYAGNSAVLCFVNRWDGSCFARGVVCGSSGRAELMKSLPLDSSCLTVTVYNNTV